MSFSDEDPLHVRLLNGWSPIGLWESLFTGSSLFGIVLLVFAFVDGSVLRGVIGLMLLLVAVVAFRKFWDLV